jgi:hypothetical protein
MESMITVKLGRESIAKALLPSIYLPSVLDRYLMLSFSFHFFAALCENALVSFASLIHDLVFGRSVSFAWECMAIS